MNDKEAVVNAVQILEKLRDNHPHALLAILEDIDMGDEYFDETLQHLGEMFVPGGA